MKRILAILSLFVVPIAAHAAGPEFPKLTGPVVDTVDAIPEKEEAALTQRLLDYQKRTGHQLVVATVSDLQGYDIKDYGVQLGRKWALGRKGVDDGAILLYAQKEKKFRIEVGYGLEYILTDGTSWQVINDTILPPIKDKSIPRTLSIPQGIIAGADQIMEITKVSKEEKAAMDKKAEEERQKALAEYQSGFLKVLGVLLAALASIFGVGFFVVRRNERKAREEWEARIQRIKQEEEDAIRQRREYLESLTPEQRSALLEAEAQKIREQNARRAQRTVRMDPSPVVRPSAPKPAARRSEPSYTPTYVAPTPTPTPSWSSPSTSDSTSSSTYDGGGGSFGGGGADGGFD